MNKRINDEKEKLIMKKNDFLKAVANKVREEGYATTLKETEVYIDAIKSAVMSMMAGGETVSIPGFVKFSVVEQKARVARNPRTGEEIKVPAKNKVKVKALGELSASV